jgi:hypothetical protein
MITPCKKCGASVWITRIEKHLTYFDNRGEEQVGARTIIEWRVACKKGCPTHAVGITKAYALQEWNNQ